MKHCKIYIHLACIVYFLGTSMTWAREVSRKPANFVPDDDVIIVPMIIEKNFIDEFNEKHAREFQSARKKLRFWLTQEQYAKDYGLENTGIVRLPTIEEKQKFLQRNYLRFISKDVERSTNKGIANTWEEWTADDEIDAIKAVELHEKVIVKAKKNNGKGELKTSNTVKVGKDSFKFGFQARPEIGMAKFTIKSAYFKGRAWLGVNGNQEIKLERRFASTNTYAFVNAYIDETRILAVVDQRITNGLSLRFTHNRDFESFEHINDTTTLEDNILQIRFNMGF